MMNSSSSLWKRRIKSLFRDFKRQQDVKFLSRLNNRMHGIYDTCKSNWRSSKEHHNKIIYWSSCAVYLSLLQGGCCYMGGVFEIYTILYCSPCNMSSDATSANKREANTECGLVCVWGEPGQSVMQHEVMMKFILCSTSHFSLVVQRAAVYQTVLLNYKAKHLG